jgi:hypothetical protein
MDVTRHKSVDVLKGYVRSRELVISVDGHAFHDGKTLRIEYQEQGAKEPLVRGFGEAADVCAASGVSLPSPRP